MRGVVGREEQGRARELGGPGIRPIGVSDRSWSPRPDFQSLRPSVASVSMKPGAKTLTRTVGAKVCAYELGQARQACIFAAALSIAIGGAIIASVSAALGAVS